MSLCVCRLMIITTGRVAMTLPYMYIYAAIYIYIYICVCRLMIITTGRVAMTLPKAKYEEVGSRPVLMVLQPG